jgi:hypothetical protein
MNVQEWRNAQDAVVLPYEHQGVQQTLLQLIICDDDDPDLEMITQISLTLTMHLTLMKTNLMIYLDL